jgi:tripartite-type tricarboxylate transporter receptor subunit TctC
MKRSIARFAAVAGAALLAAGLPAAAQAAGFPEAGHTITAIVPFAAGGGTDAFARVVAPAMGKALGTQIEVENKPGASSQIGLTELTQAKPDGYTIGFAIIPTSLAYLDPDRQSAYTRDSFTLVGPAFSVASVIAVRADGPYKTLQDLVDAAKAKPGELTLGTPGVLSTGDLAAIGFGQATGTEYAFVNFQGGGPNVTALLGGHVEVSLLAMNEALPQLESKGGNVRVLAVLQDNPNPYGLPTAKSLGFDIPSFAPDVGIVAPAGLPDDVLAALSDALKAALSDPDVQKQGEDTGNSLNFMTPADYTQHWIEAEGIYKPLIELAKAQQK